jgi:hypothetical protein
MAFVTNFNFDNLSRIGNDKCFQDQSNIQNTHACNYTLQNYFSKDCTMKRAYQVSTMQPGIILNGGHGSGAGGCNIDQGSKLTIGSLVTHPGCKIDLYQRPFLTVPFLGRGSVDPVLESQIMQGDLSTNKRTVTKLPEKSYLKYSTTPLLADIKDRVTNPAYCVEDSASEGWIRGGIPCRELTRDREYYSNN